MAKSNKKAPTNPSTATKKVKTMPANWNTTQYDPCNALVLSQISDLVYERHDTLTTQASAMGFLVVPFAHKANGTQGAVFWNQEAVVVAFRGTEFNIQDWFTDAEVIKEPCPSGEVHSGFKSSLESVWDQVIAILAERRAEPTRRSYWITGHSLGGALATLAALRLRQEKRWPINGIYTYGSPRVGDIDFAIRYNGFLGSITFRHVHHEDIVTHLPPEAFNYKHVDGLIYFDKNCQRHPDDLHAMNVFKDDLRFSDLWHPTKWLVFINNITTDFTDHKIANYIGCLGKNCV